MICHLVDLDLRPNTAGSSDIQFFFLFIRHFFLGPYFTFYINYLSASVYPKCVMIKVFMILILNLFGFHLNDFHS